MVLKIERDLGQREYIQCDKLQHHQVEDDNIANTQVRAMCWNGDKITEVCFQHAWLMENGKTIDSISVVNKI